MLEKRRERTPQYFVPLNPPKGTFATKAAALRLLETRRLLILKQKVLKIK